MLHCQNFVFVNEKNCDRYPKCQITECQIYDEFIDEIIKAV